MSELDRLLRLRAFYERYDLAAPIDLEARIAAEGAAPNHINDYEDSEAHG